MDNLKLKICGMKDPDNIQEVSALRPNYMGFIFYEKSPRFFEGNIEEIPVGIKKTGVFVDASDDFILKKVQEHNLDAIQLHGNESPEFCKVLKKELKELREKKPEIIKVFSVKEEFDFSELNNYEGIVDFFLFDTKGKNKGGNGITFNWEILKTYPSSTPFFLSGGIGNEEAKEVKNLVSYFKGLKKEHLLYCLDVNSKFEDEPGLKNTAKLKEFQSKLTN